MRFTRHIVIIVRRGHVSVIIALLFAQYHTLISPLSHCDAGNDDENNDNNNNYKQKLAVDRYNHILRCRSSCSFTAAY